MHMPFIPNCRETSRLVSESMDRQLPLMTRMLLRLHLRMCKYCHRFEQQLLQLRAISRHINQHFDAPGAAATLSAEARERIRTVLRAHSTGA
jgi:hypothetical protein